MRFYFVKGSLGRVPTCRRNIRNWGQSKLSQLIPSLINILILLIGFHIGIYVTEPQQQLLVTPEQRQSQQLFDDGQNEKLLDEQIQQMYNEWLYDKP